MKWKNHKWNHSKHCSFIDICEQSIFIDGLRTKTADLINKTATIDVGKVMKVVGFSIQGLSRSTNFTLKYSSSDSMNDLKPVYQTSKQKLSKRVNTCFVIVFSYFHNKAHCSISWIEWNKNKIKFILF